MSIKEIDTTLLEQRRDELLEKLSKTAVDSQQYEKCLKSLNAISGMIERQTKINNDAEKSKATSDLKKDFDFQKLKMNYELELKKIEVNATLEREKREQNLEEERERRRHESEQAELKYMLEKERLKFEKENAKKRLKHENELAKRSNRSAYFGNALSFLGDITVAGVTAGVYLLALRKDEDEIIPSKVFDVGSKFSSGLRSLRKR